MEGEIKLQGKAAIAFRPFEAAVGGFQTFN
jgi:hypothetical protein